MSPTDTGNFGNDDASDWVYDLQESSGTDALKEAFTAINGHNYPESPECCIALAAAEIVAAAKGKPAADLPDRARKWLGNQDEVESIKKLAKPAIAVVNKISVKSELRDYWEESDSWHEWQQAVEGLLRRLHG
ncbi:MAG TPA: DUF4259 domain-containing protein [Candidatus Angelobacter sp.]|nr:DUF4259 domain-containing protein [Candidatus Angelobacter sp.]